MDFFKLVAEVGFPIAAACAARAAFFASAVVAGMGFVGAPPCTGSCLGH